MKIEELSPKTLLTLSEFRRAAGIPLFLAHKLIVWGLISAVKMADGTYRVAETEVASTKKFLKNPWRKTKLFIKALGPGLITGAADDDPSGIGTYSSVGAKFGLGLLWAAFWLLPFMMAVQETCARIGIVTNKGLSGVLKKHYKKIVVAFFIVLLITANIVNIGADISAMAASLKLLIPINFILAAIIFAAFIIIIEVAIPYRLYAKFLKWLTLFLFSYIITGFIIHPAWLDIFKQALVPNLKFNNDFLFAMIAVFGTTISPYLFFWQTSEEVEENNITSESGEKVNLTDRTAVMRTDVKTGMFLSNLVMFFIIFTTAQVLFKNGITDIDSAQQAALVLQPLAGNQAFLLFALGIIGTGLLAVPILAGSGAYALAELMGWREGLNKKFSVAKSFYLVIILSILIGLGLNFVGISPIKALYYAAFLNGVVAAPLLFVIMIVGNDKNIMGSETHPGWVKLFGWAAFIFSSLSIIALIFLKYVKI
ncbi:MAG: iron transporter [Candidatus Nealsonbacteria bacterium CG23_combo_of_CG06-09_8_20_14_all_40_13]|uniref:Iron transporter n=1 Tax=Candidatus Nealsonbacteria bacterium CG23_combo_of_CG06-09_8_20_14_all_40_13 TaxID=1974724 RepID=A0A2G9YR24_9BACT|nr:MAG: iron transporter [Candidatus Nealsonbacteria bacterium CG23_combo_of_CG06-09_8_20_14_all_40_13]PIR71160.1 MAG: iron transporter [Candidatus Nealsonbacteria bacterium CG10_big_fil_rev_8_21_14_0_10_40_24]